MPAGPSQARAVRVAGGARVPVAGPPPRVAPAAAVVVGDIPEPDMPWWTPEFLKGVLWSLALHASLLILLAFCYLAPLARGPAEFDARLAGSPNGVSESELLTGGLNTPLPMPPAPLAASALTLDAPSLAQLDLVTPEPELRIRTAKNPSGGGGAANDNPGAGDGDGFGLARFGEGGEVIRGVTVKVGDPQFTLIWNTDGVDLDLHVIEPGGKEIYWEEPKGNKGGELDVDNTKGYGPENIYWLVDPDVAGEEKVKGLGPPGVYKWFVVYWGGFGGLAKPTHWQVRVKHDGKVTVYHGKFRELNERSDIHTLKVEDRPGRTVLTR
jgi:hypothetical protein